MIFIPKFLSRLRIATIDRDIEERLAIRKARRLVTGPAAKRGWTTRRERAA